MPGEGRILDALLPLRFFLGFTFLYAGLDKLLTPAFLRAAGAGSIAQQLQGFTHGSPLAPLIEAVAIPHPVAIGLLVAVGEIAAGIGILLGMLYRLSAAGGAAISLLFWLTSSWTIAPYYYGPDLPYAAGFLTIAFVGRPGRWALGPWLPGAVERADERWRRRILPVGLVEQLEDAVPVSPGRRAFLQAAIVGGGAIAVTLVAGAFGRVLGGDVTGQTGSSPGEGGLTGATAPSIAPGASTPPSAAPGAGGGSATDVIANLGQLQPRTALDFQDPTTGDPGVLVRLASGKCVAFDAVCTHAGCTVGYDPGSGLLLCPCHGAAFDPANQASVVGGPAPAPLQSLPIKVDQASGQVILQG